MSKCQERIGAADIRYPSGMVIRYSQISSYIEHVQFEFVEIEWRLTAIWISSLCQIDWRKCSIFPIIIFVRLWMRFACDSNYFGIKRFIWCFIAALNHHAYILLHFEFMNWWILIGNNFLFCFVFFSFSLQIKKYPFRQHAIDIGTFTER